MRAYPATLVFGAYLTERSLELTNESGRPVAYTVSSDADWVYTDAPVGDIDDEVQEIYVSVDRAALASGEHTATLEIEAEGVTTVVTVQADVPSQDIGSFNGSIPADDGDGGAPSSSDPPSIGGDGDLLVTPEILAFGTSASVSQIYVRNVGGGEMEFEVRSDTPWIGLEGATGTSGGEYRAVTVYVNRAGLPPGDYRGALLVSGDDEQVRVGVTMSVGASEDGPILWVSENRLDFGSTADADTFVVSNAGFGTLDFTVYSGDRWVQIWPASGSNTGEKDVINVAVSRDGLEPGQYDGLIEVESSDGQWLGILLHLTVDDPATGLEVDVDALDFGEDSVEETVELYNSSDRSLAFSLTPADDWIEPNCSSGALAAGERRTVSVAVRRCERTWETGLNESELVIAGGDDVYTLPVRVVREAPPSDAEIVAALEVLPPLPKTHHNFGLDERLLDDPNDPVLYEYVRVTHSVGLTVRWVDAAEVRTAVSICQQVNAANPDLPATIALHFSPYAHWWLHGAPPTYTGPEYQEELDNTTFYFTGVKNMIDAANAELGANVQVGGIFLDTEIWKVREEGPDADVWNAAMVEKYDAMYDICKSIFPSVDINWFARGRGCCNRYFNLEEQGESFSGGFYSHSIEGFRSYFLDLCDQSQAYGNPPIRPWICLGEGTTWLDDGRYVWLCDKNYALSVSWEIGAELNDPWYAQSPNYPPWDKADAFVIFPGPRERAPDFFRHFVAYARGAANMPLEPN